MRKTKIIRPPVRCRHCAFALLFLAILGVSACNTGEPDDLQDIELSQAQGAPTPAPPPPAPPPPAPPPPAPPAPPPPAPPPPAPPPPAPPPPEPPPPPPDATSPTATITSPTSSATYTAPSANLDLSGSAADDIGVTQVTWSNDRGGSGTAGGTTSWSVAGLPLQDGANIVTIVARDAAGNTGSDTLTVIFNKPANVALILSWAPNPLGDNLLGYRVYAGPDPTTATQLITDLSLSGGVLNPNAPMVTYNAGVDLGLKTGDPICFRLIAYNSVGPSGFSGAACTTI